MSAIQNHETLHVRQIIGFENVLKSPRAYTRFAAGTALTNLVQEVAMAALACVEAGGSPDELPGALASLALEDAGAIQRRIAVLEEMPEHLVSTEILPYRRLMVAVLRAKARYLLSLN